MRRSRPGRPAAPPRRPAPAWRPTGLRPADRRAAQPLSGVRLCQAWTARQRKKPRDPTASALARRRTGSTDGTAAASSVLPARARHSCRRWVREALRESSREPSSTSRKNTAPSASESCRARVSRSVSSIRPPPLVRQAPPASAVSYARGRGDVTCRRRPGPGRPPPLGRRPRPARRSPAPGSRAGEGRPGSTPPGCAPGSQPPPPWRPDRLHPGRAG